MVQLVYPSLEKIIEYNLLVLTIIKIKKADAPKVLSSSKIREVIDASEMKEGDVYDKAVILMKGLIQKHPFASGNRRTAFITAKDFISENHHAFGITNEIMSAKVMQGIRENYYSDEEIKEWIKHGKIREFKR